MSKNKVTSEQVESIMQASEFEVFHRVFDKQCLVVAKLPNGFTVVGESACVDPDNYVEEIGEKLAKERIKNRIWELEGYSLQNFYHNAHTAFTDAMEREFDGPKR
ncbi:Gp49 family protein [Fictibacillus phosphorivorans]|uniref:Gp49 family protein n=1 Tax=Fictibacillus phosphorivorans TaxID=1221500 RepID=UPI0009ED1EED|nr:Gp49 family protein [Fictibacillus phosphorivorans]